VPERLRDGVGEAWEFTVNDPNWFATKVALDALKKAGAVPPEG
jgi:hypothetical protein